MINNLKEIAAELNVGLDSIVFYDDSILWPLALILVK